MATPDPERQGGFISGVILAAGLSRRMGRPKLALPLGGKPLLQYALDAAAKSRLDEIVLVVAAPEPALLAALELPSRPPLHVAVNPEPSAGQAGSLRCGLAAANPRARAAAVLLGDQPGLTSPAINRIVEAFTHAETPAVRPVYSGSRGEDIPGHPVLVANTLWPEVESLRGDEGLRGLFSRQPDWLTTIPTPGPPPADIDTWDDYRRAEDARPPGT